MSKTSLLLAAFLFSILVPSCRPVPSPEVTPAKYSSEGFHRSTVKIYIKTTTGYGTVSASGFAVDEYRFVTAGHFCENVALGIDLNDLGNAVRIAFVNEHNNIEEIAGAEVVFSDAAIDLCLLETRRHRVPPATISMVPLGIHEEVSVVGAPLGLFPVTSPGRVVYASTVDFPITDLNRRLLLHVLGTHGNSGGPVFNAAGEVVGVVMSKFPSYDHALFCVTAGNLVSFLTADPTYDGK